MPEMVGDERLVPPGDPILYGKNLHVRSPEYIDLACDKLPE
jgi:hypothetical protein